MKYMLHGMKCLIGKTSRAGDELVRIERYLELMLFIQRKKGKSKIATMIKCHIVLYHKCLRIQYNPVIPYFKGPADLVRYTQSTL